MASRCIFLIAFSLVFYSTGAAFVESFVNYSSWHLIGSTEFIEYHEFITPRVVSMLVAPMLLGSICSIMLLWFRLPVIPAWTVWSVIALQAIVWISTVTIQIPLQNQLGTEGLSQSVIERLIQTNFWLRRIPYGICAAMFFWMALRVLGSTRKEPSNSGDV